jgi:hypothetical protein
MNMKLVAIIGIFSSILMTVLAADLLYLYFIHHAWYDPLKWIEQLR